MTPEKAIENQILSFLWMHNFYVWKTDRVGTYDAKRGVFRKNFNRYKITGVSDIIGLTADGRFLAIEVKTKYGKLSPAQEEFLQKVNANNGVGIIARSLKDVQDFLENRRSINERL